MLKVLLIILSSGILAITGGCAHVTIEKRSVPSFSPWDGDVDTNIYFPDDIGVRREIINEHIELDFLWDNYTTEYRGLKVLGIEVVREPDAINASGYIVLKLGVKNISYNEILKFKPGGVLFSVERINDGVVKVLSPKVVYQQDSALFCSFDYDLKSWGGKSKEVSDGDVVVIEKNNKDFYECFNLIYYIDFCT